jgi:hypothetical protein
VHPAALATGIAALDVVIAGQAVYAVRRRDRQADRAIRRNAVSSKGQAR